MSKNQASNKSRSRYVFLGIPGRTPRPGLYTSMQFRTNGFNTPALPMAIQTNSEAQATAFLALQPWVGTHYTLPPTQFANDFLSSALFHTAVAQVGESPDGLFWFVSHGRNAGIYFSTSLPEAFAAMLGTSEDPEGMVYEYHPSRDPIGARNVRGTVLPNTTNGPANTASQFPFRSTTPVPASSSAPSTPMRHVGSPGVVIYSPSVSLNFGSQDSKCNVNEGRPNTVSEEKGKGKGKQETPDLSATAHGPLRGVEWGRQFLRVFGWAPADVERVEELLLLAENRDDFAYRLNDEYEEALTYNQCLWVWDLYHGAQSSDL
ncbi:hypothetical protein BDP27DRAFT_1438087 [Rhodocollybia butyracea]|uniref:Uncharacterized protein n=1 Tax=Rhodocollybia butyracea TaxID=206335 RepID=A0A9P5P3X2_9AGAR|nr:hypothetical protein BDP27DRAFT_1438087 [Rhodocollybia butyracea]